MAATLPVLVHPARKRGQACPVCSAAAGQPCRVATSRTQRNRRVSCCADAAEGCGFAVYVSRKQLQRAGAWPCPCCGTGAMWPVDPDDAALVLDTEQLARHPGVVEHQSRASQVMHGQAWAASPDAAPADAVTADDLEQARRETARARRLGALRRGQLDPDSINEPMPF